MTAQVDASTSTAGELFSSNSLRVPDFQREYSWKVGDQVTEFWEDLTSALDVGDYFLGLVILTAANEGPKEVVDGQQRLLTLTMLANSIRLVSLREKRAILADDVLSTFLMSLDYASDETEVRLPRLVLTSEEDSKDLKGALAAQTPDELPAAGESLFLKAHAFLLEQLIADVAKAGSGPRRLGQWVQFLKQRVTFAVFTHPDRNAAFKVYEVINTRGKQLTPAELIKSHLIGSSEPQHYDATYDRWKALEKDLHNINRQAELTTFIRHVLTLEAGYVTPANVYQEVTSRFSSDSGVQEFLRRLEHHMPTYLQMLDPTSDEEETPEALRAFSILQALSAGRFRPVFMEAVDQGVPESVIRRLMEIITPGMISGTFGGGGVEAVFARAARRLHKDKDWDTELRRLEEERPTPPEFLARAKRGLNKYHAMVLRAVALQQDTLPVLDGWIHQVRPKNSVNWPNFSAEEYKELGTTVGNQVVLTVARRPVGARSPIEVRDRMLPELAQWETLDARAILDFTAEQVKAETEKIVQIAGEQWYGPIDD